MPIKVTVDNKIGKTAYKFEFDMEKAREALFHAAFLGHQFDKCGLCGSEDIQLTGNKAKGYTFVRVRCKECKAERQMGEYKDGGYFWKDWEEAYRKDAPDGSEDVNPKDIKF